MESEETLPSDIILEILTRISSLETLAICKVVCKKWNQTICESSFLSLHPKTSGGMVGYLFQNFSGVGNISALITEEGIHGGIWSVDDTRMRIVASSDHGILCFERQTTQCHSPRYYLCKPTTNQWQGLPNPKRHYTTVAITLVVCESRPLRYKIVRMSERKRAKYICEVFDSQRWKWGKTKSPILQYGDFISVFEASISIGQTVYWLTLKNCVLALDTNKNCYRYFGLPPQHWRTGSRLIQHDNELALICTNYAENKMKLWVTGEEGLTRRLVVDTSVPRQSFGYKKAVDFRRTGIVFIITDDGGGFYDLKDGSFNGVKVGYDLSCPKQIFRIRLDLEIVNFKPGSMSHSKYFE